MDDPQDYEYSGRQSKYPPVLLLLGYFGFGIGCIWLGFDRLAEFAEFEERALSGPLQPMIRVNWLEKLLYELGGKYVVFGATMAFALTLIMAGISRLRSWIKLRNPL